MAGIGDLIGDASAFARRRGGEPPAHLQAEHRLPMGKRIGILGGGQLARFLSLSAARLGFSPVIYCQSSLEPAALVTAATIVGAPDDERQIGRFLSQIDILTFENEFANVQFLREHLPKTLSVYPSLDIIEKIQNRMTQKKMLVDFKIPTARYEICEKKSDLEGLFKLFPEGFVMKTLVGGYDGYGTWLIRSKSEIKNLKKLPTFPVLVEDVVSFKRELAVLFVRSKGVESSRSRTLTYPLVETKQANYKCDWVRGPFQHQKMKSIEKKLLGMMNELDYVGVLAVEMFDTGTQLLVNELAPRVHNSGHYSLNALRDSQFDDHIRAGLSLPLYEPWLMTPEFVMTNLVGESEGPMQIPDDIRGFFHWYGKAENRPGRKMGHINYCGDSQSSLLAFGLRERERIIR